MQRGQFSSRTAFIFAASGSAVGLGNIWGFPTNAAENGGAAFLMMYLVLAFTLAYPALMAELIIGRHTRSNIVTALQTLASSPTGKNLGKLTGMIGVLTASLILSFYAIVAGWMIAFMLEPVAQFTGITSATPWLTEFSASRNMVFCLTFLLLTIMVISAGVENGIERWSCRLMPALLFLMVGLIVYVLFQEGATEGLKHYLVPDFSETNNPTLIISALGQAFFSMSLGVGTMLIYGSYIRADENLPVVGAMVTVTDTSVAFLSGLLVLPAIFVAQHLGAEIYTDNGSLIAGPDLIFQVLPTLFNHLGDVGIFISFVFFILMTIAALTSSISMLEVPVSYAEEVFKLNRKIATWLIGLVILTVSTAIILNFEQLFGFVVHVTTELAQPMLGIILCLFAGWVFHRDHILGELKRGDPHIEDGLFWKIWPFYVKFFCPALILLTFLQGFSG